MQDIIPHRGRNNALLDLFIISFGTSYGGQVSIENFSSRRRVACSNKIREEGDDFINSIFHVVCCTYGPQAVRESTRYMAL